MTLIYDRLHEHLLERDILHADETTLQVLREPGRAAETQSYLWLYRTGRDGPPIILYDYQTTRASKHPRRFLAGFKGYLHALTATPATTICRMSPWWAAGPMPGASLMKR